MRDTIYDSLEAIIEIEIDNSETKNIDPKKKIPEIKFKNFNKYFNTFIEIIRDLFEQYRVIEIISYKIEKIFNYYLSTFCQTLDEKNKVIFREKKKYSFFAKKAQI